MKGVGWNGFGNCEVKSVMRVFKDLMREIKDRYVKVNG